MLGGTPLEQRACLGLGHRLGAAGGSQLAEQATDMFLDGGQLDHQSPGDVLIRSSRSQQAQDFLLALGQGHHQRG